MEIEKSIKLKIVKAIIDGARMEKRALTCEEKKTIDSLYFEQQEVNPIKENNKLIKK